MKPSSIRSSRRRRILESERVFWTIGLTSGVINLAGADRLALHAPGLQSCPLEPQRTNASALSALAIGLHAIQALLDIVRGTVARTNCSPR